MGYNYKNWRAIANTNLNVIGAEFNTEQELDVFLSKNTGFHKRYVSNDEIKRERFDEISQERHEIVMFGFEVKD